MRQPCELYRSNVFDGESAWDEAESFTKINPDYRGLIEVVGTFECFMFMVCSDGHLVRYEG